ncbi:MAG TPA: serine/threonine-protein kinase [Planctomycetota bacterium]|nr:serine/threonine-protein kinase [Planctomycetota bacterium]
MINAAAGSSTGDARLLAVAVELGFITSTQVQDVLARQKQLKKGGIVLPVQQLLLELDFIQPPQLRTITDEVELRHAQAQASSAVLTATSTLRIGRYEILGVLSDNGYTRVLKAVNVENGTLAVLKALPTAISHQSQWLERFRREMNLVANLSHPNIIGVYECGSAEGMAYIAFEYLKGMPLSVRLEREGNLPERIAWLVAREVARGLQFIEERGILHRDIKPDNILCGLDGRVKIIDLGLSKSLIDSNFITAMGETVGTPFYMSPEQATGTRGLDHRTDIYALGCVTYHALTGSVPFFAQDAVEVMLKHNEAARPDPREILPELNPDGSALVRWMMARQPEDRPATCAQLVEAMTELLARLPEPAGTRSVLKVVPSAP